jgi:hypothetical protein
MGNRPAAVLAYPFLTFPSRVGLATVVVAVLLMSLRSKSVADA